MTADRGRLRSTGVLVALVLLAAPGVINAQWAAEPDTTVRNEFGPQIGDGGTTCRGACGGGCHPANCEPGTYWECVDNSTFRVVRTYDCGTNDGCREHDDCLDECARRYPGAGRMPEDLWDGAGDFIDDMWGETRNWRPVSRNFFIGECSRDCHLEAREEFGTANTVSWARGHGPFDGRNVFEYTIDAPGQEEPRYRCPQGTKLVCEGGRARCEKDDEPEDEPDDEPPAAVVGVVISAPSICNDPDQPLLMSATVIGLASPNVAWKLLSGPGTIDRNGGKLTPQGEGTVVVEAVSVSDPLYSDQAAVQFGRCECAFEATLSGDTSRGTVDGVFAVFSTRGQATIMGVAAGGPEYWQDLARAAEMAQGLQDAVGLGDPGSGNQQIDSDFLEQMAGQAQQSSPGSTLGIVLIEGGVGMAGAFKIEVAVDGSVEPGFSGTLPVSRMALHTGEFAETGGAPWLGFWDQGDSGSVNLMIENYTGAWMRGQVEGEIDLAEGLLISGRRPRVKFSMSFTAGISNPLRMENACLMAWAANAEED